MNRDPDIETLKARLIRQVETVRRHSEHADQARAAVAETVAELRAAGVTWTEIGRLIGVTRQGAVKAYGRTETRNERTGE